MFAAWCAGFVNRRVHWGQQELLLGEGSALLRIGDRDTRLDALAPRN
jgi:hypothetical protein